MTQREFSHRFEFDLRSSPEALWPFVADTNRFNRDVGLPAVAEGGGTAAAAVGRRILRARLAGVEVLRWTEEPFEWVRPHRFGVVRRYGVGPLSELRVGVELRPREGGGTRILYGLTITPRLPLIGLALPLQLALTRRKFERAFRRYDQLAQTAAATTETTAAAARLSARTLLSSPGRARLAAMRRALVEDGADAALVERLCETVERGDDLSVARLRPYALADAWGAPRREVLELCLRATRAGLLDFRWELLCPLCRGPKESAPSLRDVTSHAGCATCRIDFTVNFDRQVEVTFRPNAAVRAVEPADYCMGGPQMTPHVVVQQLVAACDVREARPVLEEGRYRLRTLGSPSGQFIEVRAGGAAEATLRAGDEGWPSSELLVGPSPSLRFENAASGERLFILERTAWSDQAVTAAEVTALQLFRDLFAEEALRPGEQISVGSLTLLFTDLRGSTRLYRQIGDAVAFGTVMNHFDVLRDAIAEEGGAVVKTLGDAVMGAFTAPAAALRAFVRAQRILASPPAGARPLALKGGLHAGPCIAVTLNGRLDYFGSNVNIAARLEPLSTGADCVISRAVRFDPAVAAMLDAHESGLTVEPMSTTLKGFDEESFDLWRVMRKDEGEPPRRRDESEAPRQSDELAAAGTTTAGAGG